MLRRLSTLPVLTCLALGALVGACQVLPAPGGEGVELRGRVQPPVGSASDLRRLLQMPASPLDSREVRWLRVFVRRTDIAGTELNVGQLPGLDQDLVLRRLRHHATYRVRLEAYDRDMVRIDDNATHPSNPSLPRACETEVQTQLDNLLVDLNFHLKLKDSPFSGVRQGQINALGGVHEVPASEAVAHPEVPASLDGLATPAWFLLEGDYFAVNEPVSGQVVFPPGVPGHECRAGELVSVLADGTRPLVVNSSLHVLNCYKPLSHLGRCVEVGR